jgi:hypothetical protein
VSARTRVSLRRCSDGDGAIPQHGLSVSQRNGTSGAFAKFQGREWVGCPGVAFVCLESSRQLAVFANQTRFGMEKTRQRRSSRFAVPSGLTRGTRLAMSILVPSIEESTGEAVAERATAVRTKPTEKRMVERERTGLKTWSGPLYIPIISQGRSLNRI